MSTEQTAAEAPKKRGRKPGQKNSPKTTTKKAAGKKSPAKKTAGKRGRPVGTTAGKRGRKPGQKNNPTPKKKPEGVNINIVQEFVQLKELLSKANFLANSIKYKLGLGE